MRSTRIAGVLAILAFAAALGACSSDTGGDDSANVPIIHVEGTRPFEYTSLDQLAEYASAVILATPTGKEFDRPLPVDQGGTADSAPTPYVEVTVDRVLAGSIDAKTIDLVSPGIDERSGQRALQTGGPYVLFVTPAMYAADQPAGGYVVVGGPAGVFAKSGKGFLRVDSDSPKLPESLNLDSTAWPKIAKTEAQLLHEGPH